MPDNCTLEKILNLPKIIQQDFTNNMAFHKYAESLGLGIMCLSRNKTKKKSNGKRQTLRDGCRTKSKVKIIVDPFFLYHRNFSLGIYFFKTINYSTFKFCKLSATKFIQKHTFCFMTKHFPTNNFRFLFLTKKKGNRCQCWNTHRTNCASLCFRK
jgi:hypothetical protein